MTRDDSPAKSTFTSDLTVDEFIVLGDAGWEPVALVSGDCTSDPGDGYWSPAGNQGDALTRGQNSAMERMRQQAARAGAAGVVGVRLHTTEIDFTDEQPSLFHFSALGTAVRPSTPPAEQKLPFTSHLSGQDTWALLDAGCRPLGMVVGIGFYRRQRRFHRTTGLHEMADLNNAVYGARERAMRHMQSQASALHARGVVGVSVDMAVSPAGNVTFTAVGTAILTPRRRSAVREPRLAVNLNDPAGTGHVSRGAAK